MLRRPTVFEGTSNGGAEAFSYSLPGNGRRESLTAGFLKCGPDLTEQRPRIDLR